MGLPLVALALLLLGAPVGDARAAVGSTSASASARPNSTHARAARLTKTGARKSAATMKTAAAAKTKVLAAKTKASAGPRATVVKKQAAAKKRAQAKQAARAAREVEKGRSRGKASWYGPKFQGKQTASGEAFDRKGLTAAHRDLPFGTRVRVTNTRNGRAIVVRINDRGPYSRGRIIDLSEGAARKIGMMHAGTARVMVEILPES